MEERPGKLNKSVEKFRRPVAEANEIWNEALGKLDRDDVTDEENREFWEATANVLAAYVSEKKSVNFGKVHEDFPPMVAVYIERALRIFLAGVTPESLSRLLRPGAPSTMPGEVSDKKSAVCYIEAVRSGLIDDRSPNKTICDNFGVKPQTVRDWCKIFPDNLVDFLPDAAPDDRAEIIANRMQRAGRRFQQAGGSHQGIANRPPAK